jgi:hypothetical protein
MLHIDIIGLHGASRQEFSNNDSEPKQYLPKERLCDRALATALRSITVVSSSGHVAPI